MAQPVEALYVPKSVRYHREGDGFVVHIKSVSYGKAMLGIALIILAFFATPVLAIFNAGNAMVLFLIMLVAGVLLMRSSGPPMRISPQGVEVTGRLYRAADASHFTDHADDGWLLQFFDLIKTGSLGLQYGIYSVHMPYALSKVELAKVAVFLTELLKTQSVNLSEERERKIQQAQSF